MKTKLENKLKSATARIKASGKKAIKRPISSVMSLCMIAGLAATTSAFSQEGTMEGAERHQTKIPVNRVITSSDGRAMAGTITAVDGGVIRFRRGTDGRVFTIPAHNLSEADKRFILTWDPPSGYRPSSVSIAGNSTLARGSYPSRFQPRYSGGSSGARRGYRVYTQSCTGRTVVVPCR